MSAENEKMRMNNRGYDCWLGYRRLEDSSVAENYMEYCTKITAIGESPVLNAAVDELSRGIYAMMGLRPEITRIKGDQCMIVFGYGNPTDFIGREESDQVGDEGFIIKKKDHTMVIFGKKYKGILYGVFTLLRCMQMGMEPDDMFRIENPANKLRMLNHWDNMDGTIERGYAGKSLFFEGGAFIRDEKRICDFARLLASVGINGVVLNNVNVRSRETCLITGELLPEVAMLADIFRAYGISVYLSVNYSSSIELGGLRTADPLDGGVLKWWCDKAKEIYETIPDFGGFLVKADSEFRPGPFTYGRNHADGANMLAKALEPFGGIVIWRCFVYNCKQDWRDRITDRANAAYDNFMPLDGKFMDNVVLQIKNGPMDFQVREPASPLFGGMKKTNQMLELQVTQEYTGQQKHICYLVPQWKEVLDFDTLANGRGSTVKKLVEGRLYPQKYSGFAAVSNTGNDLNWTGHILAQANLYGYGRLAWNPDSTSKQITEEWVRLTFSDRPDVIDTISDILLKSWETYENYTSPLGIGWMINPSHHYGPSVDGYEYSAWGTYHRADCFGIGVDRTTTAGTGNTGRYHKENAELYNDVGTCPEELLLFFHHVPYTYRLKSGKTLIQYIYDSHFEGVGQVMKFKEQWISLRAHIDSDRFEQVLERLEIQIKDASEWRDVVNSYFYRKSGIPDEHGRKIY